jgi:hypothetical protein
MSMKTPAIVTTLVAVILRSSLPSCVSSEQATLRAVRAGKVQAQSAIDNRQSAISEPEIRDPDSAIHNPDSEIATSHFAIRNLHSAIRQPEPWYDRVLRRINPSDFDYGAWLDERRAALLEASVMNPYFWYSVVVSALLGLFILAFTKSRSNFHKLGWMCSGWLADFYNETALCREQRDQAIDRHNRHIEKCNRAIESELDGSWKNHAVNEEAELWRKKYEDAATKLMEAVSQANKMEAALQEKEAKTADLVSRLQALEQKMNDKPRGPAGQPLTINETNKHLVSRINVLESQLREEQSRNRSLKAKA